MLEEKNDNLLQADGNLETDAIAANQVAMPDSIDNPSTEEIVSNTNQLLFA